ncbi:MAG: hypothetical protein JWM88_3099 [Verrucomicrobia bacterium]|nr:hypothetical protein [Verrucomicrobiota bacterium]
MDDAAAIVGTWGIVKAELNGEEMPAMAMEKMEVELGDGTYAVRFGGEEPADRGTFRLGAASELKTLLLSSVEGTNAGRTIPAIYQLAGNRLRVCYGLDGNSPDAFCTTPGANRYLVTYRRK